LIASFCQAEQLKYFVAIIWKDFLVTNLDLFFLVLLFISFPSYLFSASKFISSSIAFDQATVIVIFVFDQLLSFFLISYS
jgi:hypothetical protein